MVRTQIQLTEEQAQRAKRMAAEMGISMAELIRRTLDEALTRAPEAQEKRLRAMGIVGIGRSGRGDISVRHDDYLEEAYGE